MYAIYTDIFGKADCPAACYKQYNVVTMNDRRYIPRNFSPSADFPNESSAINPGLLLPSLKKF